MWRCFSLTLRTTRRASGSFWAPVLPLQLHNNRHMEGSVKPVFTWYWDQSKLWSTVSFLQFFLYMKRSAERRHVSLHFTEPDVCIDPLSCHKQLMKKKSLIMIIRNLNWNLTSSPTNMRNTTTAEWEVWKSISWSRVNSFATVLLINWALQSLFPEKLKHLLLKGALSQIPRPLDGASGAAYQI